MGKREKRKNSGTQILRKNKVWCETFMSARDRRSDKRKCSVSNKAS